MYGKCGSLADARKVFDDMPRKTIVAWSAMLAACTRNPDQGGLPAAIELYRQLRDAGIGADEYVFISVLDAAAKLGSLEEGKVIHGHILESGFDAHPDVAAAIVNMYGKLGRLDLAMEVFDRMEEKKLAAWNTAIAANAHNGQFGAAIALLWKLDLEGIRPDMVTLIEILAVCSWKQDIAQGIKIHERICSCGWERNVVAGTSIVNMYGKCGRIKEAKRVFNQMHVRDVVTWNAMISALAQTGHCREAIDLYKKMDVQRNSSSFMSALGACALLGSLQDGKQIHAEIIARFASLSHRFLETGVGNALINMYAKCQQAIDAKKVFDSLKEKNVITWNATIAAFTQNGYFTEALDLYDCMVKKDSSVRPDNVTYVNALHACAGLGWIVQGRDLHSRIVASEWSSDAVVMNSVMSMFVRCGSPGEAKRVFLGLKNRSAVSWTIAIAATAQQGSSNEAVELFLEMVQEGLAPDSYAFAGILFACSHGGLLDTGWSCFTSMRQDFGVDPGAEHYGCLIDLLGRAGRSNQAKELLLAMPFSPDNISWTASVSIR
ncbi:pentatricopeptide repeat-containing protein At3g12770 isoform X1 [Selaginella moellendorffii]|uniref:pentatricopeptide repeat-containing protein At3g12770 isoform X1 n=1 Tax=Selaginella moellendorffii TaxID=88036 RepID=UPI000D1C8ECC|nr:pentatricopeptide repeat-containing protein At3g12770 isoform X1 [Selaginella moellendorffii]|eukprot:XP_024517911.1 pentatricopeptide repeat-containing protein At3g12770 isoform X1 [Selaginella moellendorffii]